MPEPICFMVMPYGKKHTGLETGKGPIEVDFDALWSKVYCPVIKALGYKPVRSDQDSGAMIIKKMLVRLVHADLVIADISLANSNVYYEIGVRHAAKGRHCVLTMADWAKPVFDLNQIAHCRYALQDGAVDEACVPALSATLTSGIKGMLESRTPVAEVVAGSFRDIESSSDDEPWQKDFDDEVEALYTWSERIAGIRTISDRDDRKAQAVALRDELLQQNALADGIRLEVLGFLRDTTSDWQLVMDWIRAMPDHLRILSEVQEQRLLAEAKLAKDRTLLEQRVGALKDFVEREGSTSERWGLVGGRYKLLYQMARDQAKSETDPRARRSLEIKAEDYLDLAIDAYKQGMECDLNDFFPTCNLPALLAIRGQDSDAELAHTAAAVTAVACQRKIAMGSKDPWITPTLLLAAFQSGTVDLAGKLAKAVRQGGQPEWGLGSLLKDLDLWLSHMDDDGQKTKLQKIYDDLKFFHEN